MRTFLLMCLLAFSMITFVNAGDKPGKKVSNISAQGGWQEFEPLSIDGYFNIVNRGVTRLYCELNDRRFTLTTFADEVGRGDFIYYIPREDTVMIDIFAYLNPGFFEITKLRILPQGPADAAADLIIADASGRLKDSVDFALRLDDFGEGDANNDGFTHEGDDQFVELVNTGEEPVDLAGWRLEIDSDIWHEFEAGSIIESGKALVVFGGGLPVDIPTEFQLASKPGGFGLYYSLGSFVDVVRLIDPFETQIDTLTYSFEGDIGQSVTRSPDINGELVLHAEAASAGRELFSPGTTVSGQTDFTTTTGGGIVINEVHSDPAADPQQFPEAIGLLQNAPNPFNSTTRIRFRIPEDKLFGADVTLVIYNMLGQRVRSLATGKFFPGTFDILWNGDDRRSVPVSSVTYILHLEIDGIAKSKQ
ncbi:MAG: lamin tail domain-containing protein, partial [Calditrichota bacterium]